MSGQAPFGPRSLIANASADIPSGLGWDNANYPISILLRVGNGQRNYGVVNGIDAIAATEFSTPLAASPIYVATTGNDTTGNGTSGNPYATISKAITVGNATAAPFYIRVQAGGYGGAAGFGGLAPNEQCVIEAYGGRVRSTSQKTVTWGGLDGTYTNCYTAASVGSTLARLVMRRIWRPARGDSWGVERVATPAICNTKPGSWCVLSGTLYYNPIDGVAPTSANTLVYDGVDHLVLPTNRQRSLWLRGQATGDGFDLEGGSGGALKIAYSNTSASKIVILLDNCTFRLAGAASAENVSVHSRAVSVDGVHGIFIARNCQAGQSGDDAWNFHNSLSGTAVMKVLTVNCTGLDAGFWDATATPVTSVNGWTSHENIVAIDVAGNYGRSYGGGVVSIATTKTLLVGTVSQESYGDKAFGGGFYPHEFGTQDTATYWMDRCEARPLDAGTQGYLLLGTSTMNVRNLWTISNQASVASGATFQNY